MAISEPTIKRLWGKAAGHCSFPSCEQDCLAYLSDYSPIVIGEMAHVIAKMPDGPRGKPEGGEDTYENLILLCPTHHRLVDKAPEGSFPEDKLQQWKSDHEERVSKLLRSPTFANRKELNAYVLKRLIENHSCWNTYGPEGLIAQKNPNSRAGEIWPYRKLSLIVPNNRSITSAIKENSTLFSRDEYALCCKFLEHAEGFERGSLEPLEDIPRFPANFEVLFNDEWKK